MKRIILYHSADSDGLMSEAVCRRGLVEESYEPVESVGWDYGQPVPDRDWLSYDLIVMVDISIDSLLDRSVPGGDLHKKMLWIDHHRTALDRWSMLRRPARFSLREGVAACRLAWQWFHPEDALNLNDVTLRMPGEPWAVYLIGLRDVWKHEGTADEESCVNLELGLRAEWPFDFSRFLDNGGGIVSGSLIASGRVIAKYANAQAIEHARRGAHLALIGAPGDAKRSILMLNSQARGSMALDGLAKEWIAEGRGDEFEALAVWAVANDGQTVNVSLYHAPHRKDLDLSAIAKARGGGGHPGACGFRVPMADWAKQMGWQDEGIDDSTE